MSKRTKIIVYAMIACQMTAWACFSIWGKGFTDPQFVLFSVGMLIGQIGAGIESFTNKAWGVFAVQAYFFVFTFIAGVQRL